MSPALEAARVKYTITLPPVFVKARLVLKVWPSFVGSVNEISRNVHDALVMVKFSNEPVAPGVFELKSPV